MRLATAQIMVFFLLLLRRLKYVGSCVQAHIASRSSWPSLRICLGCGIRRRGPISQPSSLPACGWAENNYLFFFTFQQSPDLELEENCTCCRWSGRGWFRLEPRMLHMLVDGVLDAHGRCRRFFCGQHASDLRRLNIKGSNFSRYFLSSSSSSLIQSHRHSLSQ